MVTDDEKTGGWSCSECALDPEADFYKKKESSSQKETRVWASEGEIATKSGLAAIWPSGSCNKTFIVIAFSQIKTLSTLKMVRDHWTISVGHYHLFLKWKNSNTVCDSSKQSSSNILFFTEKQLFPDGRLQNKTGMATTKIVFGGSTIRWAVPWQPTEVPSPSLRRVRLACWEPDDMPITNPLHSLAYIRTPKVHFFFVDKCCWTSLSDDMPITDPLLSQVTSDPTFCSIRISPFQ